VPLHRRLWKACWTLAWYSLVALGLRFEAVPAYAKSRVDGEDRGKVYYMRVDDPTDPKSSVSFTDSPPQFGQWTIFIKTGRSRSGSLNRDYQKNFQVYDDHIRRLGKEYRVHPALIKAVVMAESAFNPRALSKAGAQGLMQLMPNTARLVGVEDVWDPIDNLGGGTRYLAQMMIRFQGRTSWAIAAYNAGPGAVQRYQGIPPYEETRAYVQKVVSLYQGLRENDLSLPRR